MLLISPSSCSAARAASGRAASSSSTYSISARADAAATAPNRPRQPRRSSAPNATAALLPLLQLTRLGQRRLSVAHSLPLPSSPSLPAPQRRFLPVRSFEAYRNDVDVELEEEENESFSVTARDSASSASSAGAAAMLGFFLSALAASAGEAAAATSALPAKIPYDPSAGSDFLRNVAGAAYVVLLVIFAFRLLRRRADFATSTRIARGGGGGTSNVIDGGRGLTPEQRRQNFIADQASESARRSRKPVRATPLRAAVGSLQAGACALLLWQVCTRVDAFFETFKLPDSYTAHNIAVTLRTVGRGLSYLLTFIFAANAVGLGGLAVQLVFYPEPELFEEEEEEGEAEEALAATAVAAISSSSSGDGGNDADEDAAVALRPLSSTAALSSSEDEAAKK